MEQNKLHLLALGLKTEKEYWLNKFSGELSKNFIPFDIEDNVPEIHFSSEIFNIGEIAEKIFKISNNSDPRLHIILTSCVILLINKYTGSNDITIGVPIYKLEKEEDYINTALAIRTKIKDTDTFKDILLKVRDNFREASENQLYPLELLNKELGLDKEDNLFDVSVIHENIHNKKYLGPYPHNIIFSFARSEKNEISAKIEYNTSKYSKERVQQIIKHFINLAGSVFNGIDSKVSEIEIIGEEEKNNILKISRGPERDFYSNKTVHQIFEEKVKTQPGLIALKFKEKSYTYNYINIEANKLAHLLSANGAGYDKTIGIIMERGPEMLISILAVWKAGGAYIPIDANYPGKRIIDIVSNSGTQVIVSRTSLINDEWSRAFTGTVIDIDNDDRIREQSVSDLNLTVNMQNLAYIIFTSGSTGVPKGVMVEHIGMMNHLCAKINDLGLKNNCVVAQNASHTFDISVWQFFVSFIVGGTTVVYDNDTIFKAEQFVQNIEKDGVTILEVVPSYLNMLLGLNKGLQELKSLDYLVVTGEEIKPVLANKWIEKFPDIPLVNAYGPTEASDDITHYIFNHIVTSKIVPIGKPIQNFNIYIVDNDMNLCPVGTKGEICVSGIGVGRGYINDEEKTKNSFFNDPFFKDEKRRLYKTGDIGRWLPDGNIEFFGRKDYQVKIRGNRIELSEIENILEGHPEIKQSVVQDMMVENEKVLVAYIVSDKKIDNQDIKDYLLKNVPVYMVPTYFEFIKEMPLTSNGKINRKALPYPAVVSNKAQNIQFISADEINGSANICYEEEKISFDDQYFRNRIDKILNNIEDEERVIGEYNEKNKTHCFRLNFSQKMMYYSEKMYPGTTANIISSTSGFRRKLLPEIVEKAINRLLEKNETFWLRFDEIVTENNIYPVQYVSNYSYYKLDVFDFIDDEKRLNEWIRKKTEQPVELLNNNLFYFALLKTGPDDYLYYFKIHHIISDGITCSNICEEVNLLCSCILGECGYDDTAGPSYLNLLTDEKEYFLSGEALDDMKFWYGYLLPLPVFYSLTEKNQTKDIKGQVYKTIVPADIREKMINYSANNNSNFYKLILSALTIYISRVTLLNEVVVGCVTHGRWKKWQKKAIGAFIKFVPLRISLDNQQDFRTFVATGSTSQLFKVIRRQKMPFFQLANDIKEKTGADIGNLLDVILIDHPDAPDDGVDRRLHYQGYDFTPLTIKINPSNKNVQGILEIEWNYQVEKFTLQQIMYINEALLIILENGIKDPCQKIADIQYTRTFNMDIKGLDNIHPVIQQLSGPKMYILNHCKTFQPNGIAGELFISGSTLEGNNIFLDKVDEKIEGVCISGNENLYNCHLLAKQISSGKIDVIGPRDSVYWIKGQRVNTHEIERALMNNSAIDEAHVIVKTDLFGVSKIIVFVTSKSRLNFNELNNIINNDNVYFRSLPVYFIQLEEIPKLTDGAADKNKLYNINIKLNENKGHLKAKTLEEKVLLDVFKKILGRQDIGANDNFHMLGGDSIKIIQLISRLNQEGYKLEVNDVLEYPIISDLSKRIKKTTAIIDQSPVTGEIPLTPIQRAFFNSQQTDLHHFNMPLMFFFKEPVSKDNIIKILNKIKDHHDILRVVFKKIQNNIVQYNNDISFSISVDEISIENNEHLKENLYLQSNIIQKSIDLENGPLIKAGLFHSDKMSALLIVFHHLIMDGISLRIIIEDIETLYNQLKEGKELQLPLKTNSYKDWAGKLNSFRSGNIFEKEKEYWAEIFSQKIDVIPRDMNNGAGLVKDVKAKSFNLSKELTDKLLSKVNIVFNTEINDILLTTLGLSLHRLFNIDNIMVALEGHGRENIFEDININRTVGWFTTIFPALLNIKHSADLSGQIIEIKESLRKIPNKGIGYGIIKYLLQDELEQIKDFQPQIAFNYLGQFDTDLSNKPFIISNEGAGENISMNRNRECDLEVIGIIKSNRLEINIYYTSNQYTEDTISRLINNYSAILEEIIHYCVNREERELTPSDLTYNQISSEDLDSINNIFNN